MLDMGFAVALCSCGGGGGGGGGGESGGGGDSGGGEVVPVTQDPGVSYHPGSADPATQAADPSHLLNGRSLVLQGHGTTYTFTFAADGASFTVERNNSGKTQRGTMPDYAYYPTAANGATAAFTITYEQEWEDMAAETETLNATFTFNTADSAGCVLSVNGQEVGTVPATFRLVK